MISTCATAAAKLILFGEHAVVYDQPAIAIPLLDVRASAAISIDLSSATPVIEAKDLRMTLPITEARQPSLQHIVNAIELFEARAMPLPATGWRLTVWSKIPFSRGLGSSAAISIAILRALSASQKIHFSSEQFIELSFELEKFHHGTPSGLDNTVIAVERPIIFRKGQPPQNIEPKSFTFVVGDTGVGKKTSDVVSFVAANYHSNPGHAGKIFSEIGAIALAGRECLEQGKLKKLGELMTKNQDLLSELEVSSPELDTLIGAAKNAGALGAKLCGAGKGGCMVALTEDTKSAETVSRALLQAGALKTFITRLK
ncbi:MAG: mevalonate kinase [Candidatus Zhuqueibacterota bacterium]